MLKIWPTYYRFVVDGSKNFEVRKNDRGFQLGDLVTLQEWDPEREGRMIKKSDKTYDAMNPFTGNQRTFKIGYVLPVDADRVAFSLLPIGSV